MSHTTRGAGTRGRRGRLAVATTAALMALGVCAGAAQATGSDSGGDDGFASLQVSKQTDPAGDPTVFTFRVDFQAHANDPCTEDPDPAIVGCHDGNEVPVPATFTLKGGETKDFGQIHKGWYTISEQTPTGWKLVDIACAPQDSDPGDAYVIDLAAGSALVELSNGESKHCTFSNAKQTAPPPPGDETISGNVAPPPQIGVLPVVTLRPGSARLTAPARCVSGRYSVSVSGSPVASVSWYVNGRYIKRTPARNSRQRRFATTFLPGANITRVQARVRFASTSSVRTKTLNVTIRRCSPARIRPQFTG